MMLIRSKLGGGAQALVIPDADILVVDEGVPDDVVDELHRQAIAGSHGAWHLAPNADVPRPRLELLLGGGQEETPDRDVS